MRFQYIMNPFVWPTGCYGGCLFKGVDLAVVSLFV